MNDCWLDVKSGAGVPQVMSPLSVVVPPVEKDEKGMASAGSRSMLPVVMTTPLTSGIRISFLSSHSAPAVQ